MRDRLRRAVMLLLAFCAVISAFYLRAENVPAVSGIPVERVFALVSPAPQTADPLAAYRLQREAQRSREWAALSVLAQQDDGAAEALRRLIRQAEDELAVEAALSALGHDGAVCALGEGAAAVCVAERLEAAQAQTVAELCARMAGVSPENVLILDGCAHL